MESEYRNIPEVISLDACEPVEKMPEGKPLSVEVKNLAMYCHLSTYAGMIIPFGNFILPLALWLSYRENTPFVDSNGKEALNFQISLALYSIACIVSCIGILLLIPLFIWGLVMPAIAGAAAARGEVYRYPLTVRFIA